MFDRKEKPAPTKIPSGGHDLSRPKPKSMVALKDHVLDFGAKYKRVIRAGEDVSDVPAFLHDALRSEKVIE